MLGFVLSTTNIVDLKESFVNITYNQTEVKTIDDWIEEEVKPEEPVNQTESAQEESTEKAEEKTERKKEENSEEKPTESASVKNETSE